MILKFSRFGEHQKTASLDKLAQLSGLPYKTAENSNFDKLKKRAKAKHFTSIYLQHLIDLDSPLKKSYTNTLFCCNTLHQVDDKISSTYCNNRWCTVCNRIRIGKAINGYLPQIKALKEPYFLTLTIPNVKAGDLRAALGRMTKTWRLMYQSLKSRSIAVVGIRKTECTYNDQMDNFHPHFHFIVDGKAQVEQIIDGWLSRYPTASRKAQDFRPADEGSMLELFKYFTKVVTKEKLYIAALDAIFQAMAGMRVFQPFGITKISEEVEELQAEIIEGIEKREVFWEWLNHDWIDNESHVLTGYEPSEDIMKLFSNIVY